MTDIERETLSEFFAYSNLRAVKLPRRYDIGWCLMRADRVIRGWVECRRWFISKAERPAFTMSAKRWMEGCMLARTSGNPFLIVVEWDDGTFYVRHDEVAGHITYGIGGRADDPEDYEPCISIPTHLFTKPTNGSVPL